MTLRIGKQNAIGGYFGLELSHPRGVVYPTAKRFISARVAFLSYLMVNRPRKVWLPYYICDSVIAPLSKLEIDFGFYSIDEELGVRSHVPLGKDDLLLYVNYFGVCSSKQEGIIQKYGAENIVFDFSQAFFCPPDNVAATIYSPRKFFGIPDGGLIVTDEQVNLPVEIDKSSINRCNHLLMRLDKKIEEGYEVFRKAEASLEELEIKRMSHLTETLLDSIDYSAVKNIRNENFEFLHDRLRHRNLLELNSSEFNGPLCYPFLCEKSNLRNRLLDNRVYVATYWPEVSAREGVPEFEKKLVDRLLPLPCDQRYSISDLERLVSLVTN